MTVSTEQARGAARANRNVTWVTITTTESSHSDMLAFTCQPAAAPPSKGGLHPQVRLLRSKGQGIQPRHRQERNAILPTAVSANTRPATSRQRRSHDAVNSYSGRRGCSTKRPILRRNAPTGEDGNNSLVEIGRVWQFARRRGDGWAICAAERAGYFVRGFCAACCFSAAVPTQTDAATFAKRSLHRSHEPHRGRTSKAIVQLVTKRCIYIAKTEFEG